MCIRDRCGRWRSGTLSQRAPSIPAASRVILRSRACSSALSNISAAVAPDSRSRPRADPRARPRRWMARSRAGRAAGELPPRGGREECMKGPRRARMPVYGAESKYLGRTEKETEWLRFHAQQAPGNSHCAPTQDGEIVVVTIPLKNISSVPVEPLAGKVVIDTNNYYPQRDGQIPELDDESTTTSELLQAHLPKSKVVKAFNHIYAAELTTHGQPAGTPNRRALVIAGDDPSAKAMVTEMLDAFGFDTVDVGPLKEGWRIQRDTPGYGQRRNAAELRRDLAAAKRYRDL